MRGWGVVQWASSPASFGLQGGGVAGECTGKGLAGHALKLTHKSWRRNGVACRMVRKDAPTGRRGAS
jgi:hypothetical protein